MIHLTRHDYEEWGRLMAKMTPEQRREANHLYLTGGEMFVRELPDGTVEIVDPEQAQEAPK